MRETENNVGTGVERKVRCPHKSFWVPNCTTGSGQREAARDREKGGDVYRIADNDRLVGGWACLY